MSQKWLESQIPVVSKFFSLCYAGAVHVPVMLAVVLKTGHLKWTVKTLNFYLYSVVLRALPQFFECLETQFPSVKVCLIHRRRYSAFNKNVFWGPTSMCCHNYHSWWPVTNSLVLYLVLIACGCKIQHMLSVMLELATWSNGMCPCPWHRHWN